METDEAEDPTNGEPPDITDNNSSNNDNNLMTSSANTTSVATCQAWVSRRPMAFM